MLEYRLEFATSLHILGINFRISQRIRVDADNFSGRIEGTAGSSI